jgi:hypothetical protein
MQPFGPAMPICEDRCFNYYSTSDNGPGLPRRSKRGIAPHSTPRTLCAVTSRHEGGVGGVVTHWRRSAAISRAAPSEGSPCSRLSEVAMNLHLTIGPIVALIAGILILVMPRLLNYIVAIYLIITGLLGLFGSGSFHLQ